MKNLAADWSTRRSPAWVKISRQKAGARRLAINIPRSWVLQEPDQRTVRNTHIISAWRDKLEQKPGLESLSIFERRGGPPGRDVDVSLQGDDANKLKAAALELQETLKGVAGISGIEDDLPFGPEQLIYSLNAQGRALGAVGGFGRSPAAGGIRWSTRPDLPGRR